MAEAIGSELCVNKYLYIGHEQQPIYQIFNEKVDPVPGNRETKRSQKIYQKNYGRIKPLSSRNFSTYITCCNLVLVNIFVPHFRIHLYRLLVSSPGTFIPAIKKVRVFHRLHTHALAQKRTHPYY